MIIYSKPGAATHYTVNLPQIGRDYWTPAQRINESPTIPTATASAGVFRQIVKFDASSIKKSYSILVSADKATIIQNMINSPQTAFIVNIGTATYDVALEAAFQAVSPTVTRVSLTLSVNEQL